MRLVIDSNRIISALIKDGPTREIIGSDKFKFYTADYIIEEVRKYKDYVCEKAKMSADELELLFSLVMEKIEIVPDEEVLLHMNEAIKIMKDVDICDSPILACALAIPNDGIWSEDKDLERQDKVKVWKTKELLKNS